MGIIWSPEAIDDIENLFDYIAADNHAAAISVYKRINEQIENLVEHSHIGRPGRIPGTRELIISETPYIVPYRVKHSQVEVIRVLHSPRKWPKKLP